MTVATRDPVRTNRFRAYGPRQLDTISTRFGIPPDLRETMEAVSRVLPFRVNEYVLTELIDWRHVPDDPIFRMTFPQPGMLPAEERGALTALLRRDDAVALKELVRDIRTRLNPHPSGQREFNVPTLDGVPIPGMQHKYRETVLYFPGQGQSCHTYCGYCFRWAQFVGEPDIKFAAPDPGLLVRYLGLHPEVSDVLVTGGDPMIMSTEQLGRHVEPLLDVESVRTIRIGTKSVAYWPQRFVEDRDSDDLLRLFERVVASGRTLAVMAHFSHGRELSTDVARRAMSRIRSTGAVVYCQAPLIAHVNDDAAVWADLWRAELALGAVPYYLFVERDTGPHEYFKVPLARAAAIFREAYLRLPGLARTVRGPVMSTTPGKIVVDGVTDGPGGGHFDLRMLQARDPGLVGRPFRAHFSATAAWLSDLRLADPVPPDLAAALRSSTLNPATPASSTEAAAADTPALSR